jgi:hypothetical protein
MSWLNELFQRKPGGTAVGNLLRTVTGIFTNGTFGTGANMITQKQADMRDLSDTLYIQKYGETKSGIPVSGVTPNSSIMSPQQAWDNAGNQQSSVNYMAAIQPYIMPLLMIIGGIIILPRLLDSVLPKKR